MACNPSEYPDSRPTPEKSKVAVAGSDRQRIFAQRQDLPGRNVKDLSPGFACKKDHREIARLRGRNPRSIAPDIRIWPRHLPLQGLRLDGAAALSLALLMLSEPRAWTGWRLDG